MKNSCPNDLTKKLLERCKKAGYNKVVVGRPTPTEYSGYFALPSISAYYDEFKNGDGPHDSSEYFSCLALEKIRDDFGFKPSCSHGGNLHVVYLEIKDWMKLTRGEWDLEEEK